MRSVKYVPADAQAREQFPDRILIVRIVGNPVETDKSAYLAGWVRFSELKPAERRAWKERRDNGSRRT